MWVLLLFIASVQALNRLYPTLSPPFIHAEIQQGFQNPIDKVWDQYIHHVNPTWNQTLSQSSQVLEKWIQERHETRTLISQTRQTYQLLQSINLEYQSRYHHPPMEWEWIQRQVENTSSWSKGRFVMPLPIHAFQFLLEKSIRSLRTF